MQSLDGEGGGLLVATLGEPIMSSTLVAQFFLGKSDSHIDLLALDERAGNTPDQLPINEQRATGPSSPGLPMAKVV